jgi:hypothetical protein
MVLKSLRIAGEPMAATALWRQIPKTYRPSKNQLPALLDRAVSAGTLFRFAPYVSKAPRYFDLPVEQYAKRVILDAVSNAPLTAGDVNKNTKARLKDLNDGERKALLLELVSQRSVIELPPKDSKGIFRYSTRPPEPREYLSIAVKRFQQAVAKVALQLKKADVSLDETARAAIEMCGQQFTVVGLLENPSSSHSDRNQSVIDDRILEAIRETEQTSRSPLVQITELRRVLELHVGNKSAFDSAIITLSREGKVSLHRHDYPQSLSDNDREMLVTDGKNFYSGIALRK